MIIEAKYFELDLAFRCHTFEAKQPVPFLENDAVSDSVLGSWPYRPGPGL